MPAYDNVKPVATDETDTAMSAHSATGPATTRAAQAFAASPQMKVLADIQAERVARRAMR